MLVCKHEVCTAPFVLFVDIYLLVLKKNCINKHNFLFLLYFSNKNKKFSHFSYYLKLVYKTSSVFNFSQEKESYFYLFIKKTAGGIGMQSFLYNNLLKDDLLANLKRRRDTLVIFCKKIYHIKRIYNGRFKDTRAYVS